MVVPVANQRTCINSAFSQTVTSRFMQSPWGQTDPTLTSLWPGVPVIGKPARADVLLVTLMTEIDRRRQR